jgi:hypothetical protein
VAVWVECRLFKRQDSDGDTPNVTAAEISPGSPFFGEVTELGQQDGSGPFKVAIRQPGAQQTPSPCSGSTAGSTVAFK